MKVLIEVTPQFKVGDPKPEGYIARQEWAAVHMKAGLKQEVCCHCCKWMWPHELSKTCIFTDAERRTRNGCEKVRITSRICNECEGRRKKDEL